MFVLINRLGSVRETNFNSRQYCRNPKDSGNISSEKRSGMALLNWSLFVVGLMKERLLIRPSRKL